MYPAEPFHDNPTFFVKKNTMSYPLGLSSTDEVSEDDLAALAGQERLTILDQGAYLSSTRPIGANGLSLLI